MNLMIAMVLLDSDIPMIGADIPLALREEWPHLPPFNDIEESDGMLSLRVDESDIIYASMPAAIPWADLEGPCATSHMWLLNATGSVKSHKSHIIVTVRGDLTPFQLSILLTQATVAVLQTTPSAIGVYWNNASLLIPKVVFIEIACEQLPEAPIDLWIDCHAGLNDDGSSWGFTTGLARLGHMELETQSAPESPEDLINQFFSVAGYLLKHGPVIRNGDTIGETDSAQIQAKYSDSAFGIEGRVMQLEFLK